MLSFNLSEALEGAVILKIITYLFRKTLLEKDLIGVTKRSIANSTTLYQDKFLVINHCLNSSKTLRTLPFRAEIRQYCSTEGQITDTALHIKDMEVNVSEDRSWMCHVNAIVGEARNVATWVLGAFRNRTELTTTTLLKS